MAVLTSRNITQKLKEKSLSRSLLLGITATVFIMLLVMTIFHYNETYIATLKQEEQSAISRTTNLAKILALPVWNIDYDTVERIISVFSESEVVLTIRVEEPTGTLISEHISQISDSTDQVISQDIVYNDQVIGRIITHLSFAPIREVQLQQLIYHISFVALLLLAILGITRTMLNSYLRKPLAQLATMINQLRTGDYPEAYEMPETRELCLIAENFKAMAKEVTAREYDLTHINHALQENIEERKRVEKELRASQEQFSLVAASTMDAITDHVPGNDYLSYTSRWKDLTGYNDAELTHSLAIWQDRIHPDDKVEIHKISQGKNTDAFGRSEQEYRFLHKDGRYRWFNGRALAIRDNQGELARIIGVHTDITAKKHAEQHLISTKEMLQSVIDCMPSLMIGVTEKMKVTLWNTTAEEATDIPSSRATGMKFNEIFPELSFIDRHIKQSLSARKTVTVPKVTSMRNGVPLTYDIVVFPVSFETKPTVVLRIDDITEKLRMEDMIIQTEKMASISGLAAGMAHEINNPLGGILQGVQNIQRRFSPRLAPNINAAEKLGFSLNQLHNYMDEREINTLLDGIADSGKRAASIISNMLEFSRSSEIKRIPVNVHDVIEKSIELASNDYLLRKKQHFGDITILREYDNQVSQISCSPQEIEQVLLNLLKNAAQAMSAAAPPVANPTIVITTELTVSGVMISIADNGPGMSEDIRKRVFEPFYTTKPVGEGTGLGLSVSYFIITNNHSGTISVTAAKDQGAAFNIYLPIAM